jgi:hypothetical protein
MNGSSSAGGQTRHKSHGLCLKLWRYRTTGRGRAFLLTWELNGLHCMSSSVKME